MDNESAKQVTAISEIRFIPAAAVSVLLKEIQNKSILLIGCFSLCLSAEKWECIGDAVRIEFGV